MKSDGPRRKRTPPYQIDRKAGLGLLPRSRRGKGSLYRYTVGTRLVRGSGM